MTCPTQRVLRRAYFHFPLQTYHWSYRQIFCIFQLNHNPQTAGDISQISHSQRFFGLRDLTNKEKDILDERRKTIKKSFELFITSFSE